MLIFENGKFVLTLPDSCGKSRDRLVTKRKIHDYEEHIISHFGTLLRYARYGSG